MHRPLLTMAALTATLLTTAATAQTGGTLRIAYSAIKQLDPYKIVADDELNVTSQIFDTLVYTDQKVQARPLIATSWKTPDSTTWVFTLRRGVKFQDDNPVFAKGQGREVVADDVVYSINRFLKTSTLFTLGDVKSARALGKYQVEIKTSKPNPFLVSDPNRLARMAIVPHEGIEKLGEEGFAKAPIGSGPFRLRPYTPNGTITLDRNPNYWLPTKLAQVQFVYLPDPTVATLALQGGRVDAISYLLNVDSATQLATQPNVKLIEGAGSYRGLGFNVRTAPFDDFAVRDAISKAMDIDSAYKSVLGTNAVRAYGQVPPWVPFGYDPTLKNLWKYDPAAAAAELTKAGYAKNSAGLWAKGGKPLSFDLKTIAGSQVRVLTVLVTQLKEFGIDARILQQDVAVWASDLGKGNNTGLFFDYSFAATTGLYSLFGSDNIDSTNTHFYKNAAVDALFAKALSNPNAAQRATQWKQAQRQIMKDRAAIPLYFEKGYSVVGKNVQDFYPAFANLKLVSPSNNVFIAP